MAIHGICRPVVNNSETYRPEVDGLRAIAVLGVLVFHLRSSWLPGGFVGVDVFFVISGFLITRIILQQLKSDEGFSFRRFYLRRIRRLFPALFVTLTLSTLVAVQLLSAAQLDAFAGALTHAVVSLSNVYFWDQVGYFDVASDTKPLLHTWSLSVEEQFYLLWPLALVIAYKVHAKLGPLCWVIATIVVGLALNIWILDEPPQWLHWNEEEAQSAVFFLTPFRMFELALGGLGYFVIDRVPRQHGVTLGLALTGLSMIAYTYWFFEASMEFPSVNALIPCLATLLILLARPKAPLTGLLGNRPLAAIGKASYSIYLIHWPLYVFWQQWVYRPLRPAELALVFVLSLAMGGLMYRFVEQPFRRTRQATDLDGVGLALSAAGLSLVLCFCGAHIWGNEGWPSRWDLPDDVDTKIGGSTWKRLDRLNKPIKDNEKKTHVLLIGDSQMADFINIGQDAMKDQDAVLRSYRIRAECIPYMADGQRIHRELAPLERWNGGWSVESVKKRCPRQRRRLKEVLEDEHFDRVIIGLLWQPDHRPYLEGTLRNIEKWGDAPVSVVGNKELRGSPLPLDSPLIATQCLARRVDCSSIKEINRFGADYLGSPQDLVSDYLDPLTASLNIPFFDFARALCSSSKCLIFLDSGAAVYKDKGHFSERAFKGIARHVKKPLSHFLNKAIPNRKSQY